MAPGQDGEVSQPRPAHVRVLLVEDNPSDARLLRATLVAEASDQFEVVRAERLAEALVALRRATVDVVLLDLGLPDSQGLETFSQVAEHAPHVPVVVLSGLDDESVAFQAVQAGAQDYLVKGEADGRLLVRALRYAVARQRAEQAQRVRERLEGVMLAARTMQHELNNQLALTVGYAELLANDPVLPARLRELAEEALRGAQAATATVDRLQHITTLEEVDQGAPGGAVLDLGRLRGSPGDGSARR